MSIELENAIEILTDELRDIKNITSVDDYWRRVFVAAAIPELQRQCNSNYGIATMAVALADAILAGLEARK